MAFSKIIEAKDKLSSSLATGVKASQRLANINLAAVQDNLTQYRPVYRIVITYPHYNRAGQLSTYTTVVADTSKKQSRRLGLGISDILGLWIDIDDVKEPDKASVVIRVDPELTVDTILNEGNIDDEYLAFNKLYAARNWLDIWIGYESTDGKKLEITPEEFNWYSETHLFSGPIVLVDRKISNNGDVLTISAFSAEMILKNAKISGTNSLSRRNFVPNFVVYANTVPENPTSPNKTFSSALKEIFESFLSFSDWEATVDASELGFELNPDVELKPYIFTTGDFYWKMVRNTIERIKRMLQAGATVGDQSSKQPYPLFDPVINVKIFSGIDEPRYKLKSSLNMGKDPNLWDAIIRIIQKEHSNFSGLGFRIIKTVHKDYQQKFEEGEEKHPGANFQFYYELDVDETAELYRQQKEGSVKDKILDIDFQDIVLGEDVLDLESYIDYATVFNSFRIRAQSLLRNPDVDPLYNQHNQATNFPIDYRQNLGDALKPGTIPYEFWRGVFRDIRIYGEQRFPIEKWFATPVVTLEDIETSVSEASGLDKSIVEALEKNPDFKGILNHDGITRMFKRYYFGGLEGTAMAIGNPSLKAHRFLTIRNVRNATSTAFGGGTSFGNVGQLLRDKIYSKSLTRKGARSSFARVVTSSPPKPIDFTTKMKTPIDKNFFIWKVRHYLGPNAGYITKVYWTQSRSRAWRLHTRDIADIMRQSQRISREL